MKVKVQDQGPLPHLHLSLLVGLKMTPPYQAPGSPCQRNFRGFQFLEINPCLSMGLVLLGLRRLPAVLCGCWDLIFPESLQPWWEDFITLGIIHVPSLALAIAHSPPFLFQTCTQSQPPPLTSPF